MKFDNSFSVEAPPEEVWMALMDVERVAPCMPGAEVLEQTGENAYKVQVRVKVGPMSMTYRGQVEITDRDEQALTGTMRVQARETRGQGNATATVEVKVSPSVSGAGATAEMATDLRLSGRAAQMGRGVIGDVSEALLAQFAGKLEGLLSADGAPGIASASGAASAAAPSATAVSATAPSTSPQDTPPAGAAAGAEQSAPRSAEAGPAAALDAGQLLSSVLGNRLRDPVSALIAAASFVLGFVFGRSGSRS